MALVVVASAKGAPGVTTLTVALAALTPGAIAADLDPDGGDLALRYRRDDAAPLDPELGLLSLAASLRRDHTEVALTSLDEHLQVADGGLEVLLGVTGPDQAVGLGPLWAPLARALAGSDRTVFADCGRLGPASPAMPVLMQADAVIMLARAELEELAHLRERLRMLTAAAPGRYNAPARIGVVLVAGDRDRAAGPRTEQLLRSSGVAVPVLGTIADDARGAGKLRGLHGGRAGRSTLVRSVRSLLPAVTGLTGTATLASVAPSDLPPAGSSTPDPTGPGDEVQTAGKASAPSLVKASPPVPAASQPVVPQSAVPDPAVPQPAVPQPVVPQSVVPQPVVPQSVVPQPVVSQAGVPQPAVPEAGLPGEPDLGRGFAHDRAGDVATTGVLLDDNAPTGVPLHEDLAGEAPDATDPAEPVPGVRHPFTIAPEWTPTETGLIEERLEDDRADSTQADGNPFDRAPTDDHQANDRQADDRQADDRQADDRQADAPADGDRPPGENGWPRADQDTGTLSGVTATVLQNWGR